MKVLLLTSDAYGANGGIALYNRDVIEALVAMPEVDEVVVIARGMPTAATSVPPRVRLVTESLGGKVRFVKAAQRASSEGFGLVICGHINLLPVAALVNQVIRAPLVLMVYGIDVWQPPYRLARQWLKAVDAIFSTYKDLRIKKNLSAPNTLMMRFSKGAKAYLAPEYGYTLTAWIGNPVPRQMKRGMEVLEAFQVTCMANGGKSHWGKMNNRVELNPTLIQAWFPKLHIWKQEMRKFNPNNTFSNAFTDRFGLTQ